MSQIRNGRLFLETPSKIQSARNKKIVVFELRSQPQLTVTQFLHTYLCGKPQFHIISCCSGMENNASKGKASPSFDEGA